MKDCNTCQHNKIGSCKFGYHCNKSFHLWEIRARQHKAIVKAIKGKAIYIWKGHSKAEKVV